MGPTFESSAGRWLPGLEGLASHGGPGASVDDSSRGSTQGEDSVGSSAQGAAGDWCGLDAVLLTHGHHDAVLGLGALREVQLACEAPHVWGTRRVTPVHADRATLTTVEGLFAYMFRREGERVVGGAEAREIATHPHVFEPLPGLAVHALPVRHGGDYPTMGFAFGARGRLVCVGPPLPCCWLPCLCPAPSLSDAVLPCGTLCTHARPI